MPKRINDNIDKINRNFLWNNSSNPSKLHYISWNKITRPRNMGGLGIKRANLLNAAYMAKLRWELTTETRKTWVTFFLHKYKNITYYNSRKTFSMSIKAFLRTLTSLINVQIMLLLVVRKLAFGLIAG